MRRFGGIRYRYSALRGGSTSDVNGNGERIYGYDNLNRLTEDTRDSAQLLQYDRNGNPPAILLMR